ncbi:MAG TPA: TetR-like C-terminal domain-containing protein [Xanthobacteraceae bacterium]|nr:TetR-like C-terminal domain-containing protein [Xanthobacteraceae bacterium]
MNNVHMIGSVFLNIVQEKSERCSKNSGEDMAKVTNTLRRRQNLKQTLVRAAEKTIAKRGLAGLRARELAVEVGCAVGAIYNVVEDIDDLIMLVNERTLAALERSLIESAQVTTGAAGTADAIERLVGLAVGYLDFAHANGLRWRAMFDHRLPKGRDVPDWYRASQRRLFGYVEAPLRALQPGASDQRLALLARSLFSAVHGVVELGLDEKLQPLPVEILHEQVAAVAAAIGRGMAQA